MADVLGNSLFYVSTEYVKCDLFAVSCFDPRE